MTSRHLTNSTGWLRTKGEESTEVMVGRVALGSSPLVLPGKAVMKVSMIAQMRYLSFSHPIQVNKCWVLSFDKFTRRILLFYMCAPVFVWAHVYGCICVYLCVHTCGGQKTA